MAAIRDWQAGDVVYQVQYCPAGPAQKFHEEAEREQSGAWVGDHCMRYRDFSDFKAAATFARNRAGIDWFGVTSIHKIVCEDPRYDCWDDESSWEIESDTDPASLDPEDPDNTH